MRYATRIAVGAALLVSTGACTIEDSAELTPSSTTAAASKKPPPTTAPGGKVTALTALTVGQCFDELPDPTQTTMAVNALDCAAGHVYEVFDVRPLSEPEPPPGTPFPGDLTISDAAENICYAAFEPFIGKRWEESDYTIQTWWPSRNSWEADNDRTVVCATRRSTGARTVGSVRGTGQ